MKRNNRLKQIMTAAAGCLVIATGGYAQSIEKGELEATGQVGIATGVGTHASFAGSVGGGVTDRVFAFGEFGYVPLGGASASVTTPGAGFEFASSGRLLSFMGGAQYQLRETRSFVPYVGAALGFVHSSFSASTTVGGTTTEADFSNSDFYVSFSGGARYYVKERWGFKPEFTIFAGDETFFRFAAGIFYQFRR